LPQNYHETTIEHPIPFSSLEEFCHRGFIDYFSGFFVLGHKPIPMDPMSHCCECGKPITPGVYEYSIDVLGYALCLPHQGWISRSTATPEAKALYFALKEKNLPVELEYFDGIKTVDIAVPGKLYIEVDGRHHAEDPEQAFTDLRRTFHSLRDHIPTIRIPNTLTFDSYLFQKAVDTLSDLYREVKKAG
jgi:hypothetical protein